MNLKELKKLSRQGCADGSRYHGVFKGFFKINGKMVILAVLEYRAPRFSNNVHVGEFRYFYNRLGWFCCAII